MCVCVCVVNMVLGTNVRIVWMTKAQKRAVLEVCACSMVLMQMFQSMYNESPEACSALCVCLQHDVVANVQRALS